MSGYLYDDTEFENLLEYLKKTNISNTRPWTTQTYQPPTLHRTTGKRRGNPVETQERLATFKTRLERHSVSNRTSRLPTLGAIDEPGKSKRRKTSRSPSKSIKVSKTLPIYVRTPMVLRNTTPKLRSLPRKYSTK